MKSVSKIASLVLLLILCMIFMFGCTVSPIVGIKQSLGYYPNSSDFPNTRWKCHEMDISLDMYGNSDDDVGVYTVNGKRYLVKYYFVPIAMLEFEFYPEGSETSASIGSESLQSNEDNISGFVSMDYEYNKKTGLITCKVYGNKPVDGETFPKELTFEKIETK